MDRGRGYTGAKATRETYFIIKIMGTRKDLPAGL